DVARAELDRVVEVAELALVPHLHRRAVAGRVTPDADALGVRAIVAEGRAAAGTDPFVAALMAAFLLLEALAEGLHQLVPAELLEFGALLGRQMLLRHRAQPVFGQLDVQPRERGDALEVFAEGLVEAVVERLVLDQAGAREEIELVDRRPA